jgi:hypothetical protein
VTQLPPEIEQGLKAGIADDGGAGEMTRRYIHIPVLGLRTEVGLRIGHGRFQKTKYVGTG